MAIQSAMSGQKYDLRFGVLGPFTVHHGSMPIYLPAAKHRAVLGLLLANADCVVSSDRLVDELWLGTPPDTARKTVQGYIWRIRRALRLSSSQLATVASGYRLAVSTHTLDALAFEQLAEAARTALSCGHRQRGANLLSEALKLWRGSAFDCIPETPNLRVKAARLNEAKLNTYEHLVTIQLELGQHFEIIPELTGMVGTYPYRESMHRLLMTALYRIGRPLDALDVFVHFRQTVAAVYGLDPHPETMMLHQRILQGASI